jgi:phosphoglycerol geranylgeranyltransferase
MKAINSGIYQKILDSKAVNKKLFAVLIDPDSMALEKVDAFVGICQNAGVDLFFVGGSLVLGRQMDLLISRIKSLCQIPVVLFPGSPSQISPNADAMLLLSLISGRNPELLIGKHVEAAPLLRQSGLELIPTGYLLVDGGAPTSVSYMSNTFPIPHTKNEIAVCTAMAGEILGLKMIYLEAGSGALHPVSSSMIRAVRQAVDIPLIVGGGIQTPEKVKDNIEAGADIIVVGNAIEKNWNLIGELARVVGE